jgi:uncharacterized protein
MLENNRATNPPNKFGPVDITERISSVDVLRGFALLGILMINIGAYALPNMALFNPLIAGGFIGLNQLTWQFSYVVFFQKMMAIFSMLFGAGLILMSGRAEAAGKIFGAVYYRRIFWLAVFGIIHAYFIWFGDILFSYAVCGVFLYPVRKLSGRWLVTLGVIVLLIGAALSIGTGVFFEYTRSQHEAAEAARQAGEKPTAAQEGFGQAWEEISTEFNPSSEKLAEEINARRGGYWVMTKYMAPIALGMQTQSLIFYIFWRALALMLIGMGLMKLGVFSAERSFKFYAILMVIGYGAAMPISGYGASLQIERNFDFAYFFRIGGIYDYISSVFVGLGHVGLIMIICKTGLLKQLTERLAAVGRMALTNYLMHSVVMAVIFFGFGLGLFGRVDRFALLGFVLGMWILQLIISPLWLKYFRFGPMEWLWRTLTYFKRQPMRV